MDKKIQEYYSEYKKFINVTRLPNIITIIKDDTKDIFSSYAYVDRDCLNETPIPLYISCQLFAYKEQFYKSILYHEFTHICDWAVTLKNMDITQATKLMSTYSEFHASQIELLCNLGYNRAFNIFEKFDICSKLQEENKIVDVNHYLVTPYLSL